MRNLLLMAVAMASLSLAVPALADDGQMVGTVVGAGAGGVVGNALTHGSAVGTAAGVVAGGVIGSELSRPSYNYYSRASYSLAYSYPDDMFPHVANYPSYQPNYVALPELPPPQPITYIDDESGSYCRQITEAVRVGNHMQEHEGTACLLADGSWHIVQ